MPTQDEEIARHLREAARSGELERLPGYGKPLPEIEGWDATPEELRMPFKILKDAGFAPPEIELFHERARLQAELDAASEAGARKLLERRLAELQQKIALRLESLRANKSL